MTRNAYLENKLNGIIMSVYRDGDKKALERANAIEEKVDEITEKMNANHVVRLLLKL